jgi:DNA-directed RNA polymerase
MSDLMTLQESLEDRMVSLGAERYANDVEVRGLSVAAPGKELRKRALEPTAAAIKVKLESKRGRPPMGAKFVRGIDPYVLADLTLRRAIDGALRGEKLLRVAKDIGRAVEWHVRDARLFAAHKALWNRKQEDLKTTQNEQFRRKSIDGSVASLREWARETGHGELAAKLDDVKGLDWDDEQMVEAGIFLLDLFCEASDLVATDEVRSGKHSSKAIVRFTEGTKEWLEKQNEYHALLRPVYLPMVVEPKPWINYDNGGYLDNSKARVPFIMTRAKADDRDTYDLTDALEAVTLIQSTPFRVNHAVYDVMHAVWSAGSGIGRVPPKHAEDGRASLPGIPPEMLDPLGKVKPEMRETKAYRDLMRLRRDAYKFNSLFTAEVDDFARLMRLAGDYRELTFWHPHKLDWRQRCYPVCNLLSPQGDQFNRGLIEFARGKRMGESENSAAWLAIHGANTYGVDKCSFEDRVAWVEAHQSEIITAALDPLGDGKEFWTGADGGAKAWPFLAFCCEWEAYLREGAEFVTHLPVALDGSNSGLQHLSAMVRDVDGAAATNVSPSETPADIYTEICDRVTAKLRLNADQLASIWLAAGIDRKVCKQPTMTYTYSATLKGMEGQIKNALHELDRKAQSHGKPSYLTFTDPTQSNADAAHFLAPIVLDAIKDRLPRAAAAMDFLVESARVVAALDLPVRWMTPAGVPVVQFYPKHTEVKKSVFVAGRRHRITIQRASTTKVDKRATSFGISPNFVHSMDSTHLLWTVLFANDEYGIEDFSMIHDSFGTHATDCDRMAYSLREMFVRLYDGNRLAEFHAELASRLPPEVAATLPEPPEQGPLDLSVVRESRYFFA